MPITQHNAKPADNGMNTNIGTDPNEAPSHYTAVVSPEWWIVINLYIAAILVLAAFGVAFDS